MYLVNYGVALPTEVGGTEDCDTPHVGGDNGVKPNFRSNGIREPGQILTAIDHSP